MDNRLTKKRLSDFFAYEWIMTIIIVIAAILTLELVYTVSATRLSTGQQFKYYFDETLYDQPTGDFYELLGVNIGENGKTFSYDVLSVQSENILSSYNVLSARLSVQEGDAIFTSKKENENGSVNAKTIVDDYPVYDFASLKTHAKEYLSQFLSDSVHGDVYNEQDYDETAIRAYFDKRMKGDNRFRTEEDKEQGRLNEIARIKKLAKETKDFEKLLSFGEETGLFFVYTRFEQAAANGSETVTPESESKIFGLNLHALTGKRNVSDYFKIANSDNAEDVVLVLFDFSSYQYDLQFECISFLNTLVREFSNFLD